MKLNKQEFEADWFQNMASSGLLSTKDLSKLFGVSVQTICTWAAKHKLPYRYKIDSGLMGEQKYPKHFGQSFLWQKETIVKFIKDMNLLGN